MLTLTTEHATQIDLDVATDAARHARNDWQRAIEHDLRALKDYVHDHQLIIWRPGDGRAGGGTAFDVQLATASQCTCSHFKLRDRCEHIAFVRTMESLGIALTENDPVHAGDLEADND